MPRKKQDTVATATSPDPYEGLSNDGENAFLADLLEDAAKLAQEKSDLQDRVSANRDAVRMVVKTGHLSEVQAKAASIYYPERTTKSTDEAAPAAPAAA